MKKLLLILTIGIMIISYSSPSERADLTNDYGEIIWRSHPTSKGKFETFLCKNKQGEIWVVKTTDNAHLQFAKKVNGYIVKKQDNE